MLEKVFFSVLIFCSTTASAQAQSYTTIPGKIEAESYFAMSGIRTENTSDTGGGINIGWIENGDYADYMLNVAIAGTYEISFRVATNTSGGNIGLEIDGKSLGAAQVNYTGGWQNWQTVSIQATLSEGNQTMRLLFSGGSGYLLNVNHISFTELNDEPMIIVPNTITPNGDGFNDTWIIGNIERFPGSIVKIYTRQGDFIYESINYDQSWMGTFQGSTLPEGIYYYVIDKNDGKNPLTGYVAIVH